MTYRKLVMPEDENPAKRLFGGRLLQWADEAAALYAMCQMRTKSLVTLKVSEVLFKNAARSGDILEFWTRNGRVGRTSLTVDCWIIRKLIGEKKAAPDGNFKGGKYSGGSADLILSCQFVFVAIDSKSGKPVPHGM